MLLGKTSSLINMYYKIDFVEKENTLSFLNSNNGIFEKTK